MPNDLIAKKVGNSSHFNCEMCGKTKLGKMYEYKPISYVEGYIPPHLKQICVDCIYKEVYGSKFYKIKKKEGTLDK